MKFLMKFLQKKIYFLKKYKTMPGKKTNHKKHGGKKVAKDGNDSGSMGQQVPKSPSPTLVVAADGGNAGWFDWLIGCKKKGDDLEEIIGMQPLNVREKEGYMADSEPAHGFYNIPSQEPSKDDPPSPVGESPFIKPEVPVELTRTGVAGMQKESAVIFDQAEITRIQNEFDENDRLESEDIAKANAQPEEPVHADQENADADPKKKNKSRGKKRSKAKAQAEDPAELERVAALEQERLEREIEAQAIA
jgi:hypothetical protein